MENRTRQASSVMRALPRTSHITMSIHQSMCAYVWDPKRRVSKKAKLRRETQKELSFGKVELHSKDMRPPQLVGTALGKLNGVGPSAREIGRRMVVVVEVLGNGAVCEIDGTAMAKLDIN